MKTIADRKIFREKNQGAVFSIYYEIVITVSALFALSSMIVELLVIKRSPSGIFYLNLIFFLFLSTGMAFRKKFSPWFKEIILITICLGLLTTAIITHMEPEFEEPHPEIYQYYMIFLGANFLVITIGSIIKMYCIVTTGRQINPVSGLGNTRWLSLLVNRRIEAGLERGTLLVFSIKNFRTINAIFGRPFGDRLIRIIADLFREVSSEGAKAAHLSGIEFCVWSETHNILDIYSHLDILKQNIIRRVEETGTNTNLYITTAAALYPQDGQTFNDLFCKANMALEKTLLSEERSHVFYNPEIEKSLKTNHFYSYELKHAIEKEDFRLSYQLKYDMEGKTVRGVEALARWTSEPLGEVSPAIFIPMIHKAFLTIPFTRQIIRKVFRDMPEIARLYGPDVPVSINIPPTFIQHFQIVPFVMEELKATGIEPRRVIFEITEDLFIEGSESFNLKLRELQELGIRISLDDFGTGFSSLSCLQDLPINELKIDKSFIDQIVKNHKSFILVKAICDIARANDYEVVAEGVESREQVDILKQTSCSFIQGYIYSHPEPIPAKSCSNPQAVPSA